ncbi:helix-turn-helix domain-containing protein [Croceibacterium sp. LX-88]|uniref:Helix-turn-helix domain-containing protein n=1 Tax=Croceibacterium selenioxidans TaxID=2838833 RepID=A0ABS5W7N9_9SPHN|nr:helix-turn-helix domain-containing protein [Croceibacterium selenioxidans]MBT2135768.1 helix-turn-helix domain-containing protein [Croceibacterium selenioxidans]
MPNRTPVEPQAASPVRGAHRVRLQLEVSGSFEQGGQTTALIHNLSATGILIETTEELSLDQRIAVDLPEAGQVGATVVWTSGRISGCRLDQPLRKAVLSAALLRSPSSLEAHPLDEADDATSRQMLADRLLDLRRRRGLSRTALAERAGLSAPSLWAWETGRVSPRRKNLLALARALDVSERELLPEDDGAPLFSERDQVDPDNARTLDGLIRSAKQRIAAAAGVAVDSVKITIEL